MRTSASILTKPPGPAEPPRREGFWARLESGYGALAGKFPEGPRGRKGFFALGFSGGVSVDPHVRLGLQLNGWLIEPFDPGDPTKGVAVSTYLLVVHVYPWKTRGFFVKGGAGRAVYTNNHAKYQPIPPFSSGVVDVSQFGGSGWATAVGIGYDLPVFSDFSVTPVLNYSRGSIDDPENRGQRFNVLEVGVGITYR